MEREHSKAKRIALSLFLPLAFLTVVAQATSVSFFMDQSNIAELPDGAPYLKVTLDDQGAPGDINFTVETLSSLNSLAANKFGLDQFGFNTNIGLTVANIANLPTNWTLLGLGNMDGFGGFSTRPDTNGANFRVDPLTFSIAGVAGDTLADYIGLSTGNAGRGNAFFAAHVAGFDASGTTSGFFATVVPAPAAVWLFGSGLLGLIGTARRRV